MTYTYKHDIQGTEASPTHYLRFQFDRVISVEDVYRCESLIERATPKVVELMDALSKTPHVLPMGGSMSHSNAGHIHVSGCELTVEIVSPTGDVSAVEIANQVVKKVQRRFAKGESRQRVLYKDVVAKQKALNLKTWGNG